jgi:signal transduction histidine kinase
MRDQVSALTLRYHRKKDGTVFPVEMSLSLLFMDGREMAIAATRDITGRLEAERRQQQLNGELIHQNGQLQQFSFITSHNLRAPVANLLGLLELYDAENPAAPGNLTVVANLERTVRRLDEVIYDLNELLVVRKGHEERQEVRFAQVLEQVLLSVGQQIEQSQAQLTADFVEAPTVSSVKSYVQSILLNLVSNAVKYRSPERPLCIRVETRREGPYVRLAVTDNGLGIDLHKHGERLFGLYRRFHPHLEGKGLGLHLVKTQIEALGGKVTVESQPGQGSTFCVFFREA